MTEIPNFQNEQEFLSWWKKLPEDETKEMSQNPQIKEWLQRCEFISKTPTIESKSGDATISLSTFDLETDFLKTLSYQEDSSTEKLLLSSQRYTDKKEFGRGGMGKVILSIDEMFSRPVARKFSLDPSQTNQFLREAKITGYLDHPNIVPVHEIAKENGELYFSMKAIQGEDLASLIGKQAKKESDAKNLDELLYIFIKICDAIAYAHSKNIIHRDLKPANVMVGAFGEVYVTDWGLAKHLNEDEFDSVTVGEDAFQTVEKRAVKGSPSYMPPEQVQGKATKKSDIYALGALLYELLSYKRFRTFKEGSSAMHAITSIVENNGFVGFIKPREANPTLPEPIANMILKAIQPDEDDRYESVEALREDIKLFQSQRRVRAEEPCWQAEELINRGGNLEEAIKLLDKAIELDPEYKEAYFRRGLAKYLRFEKDLTDFRKANEISEKTQREIDVRSLFYAGMILIDLKSAPKEAMSFFEKIIKNKKVETEYTLLGESILEYINNNFEEAIKIAQKATQKNPTFWEGWYIQSAFFWGGLGDAVRDGLLNYKEDEKQALECLNEALKINPRNFRCLIKRATLAARLEDHNLMDCDVEMLKNLLPEHINKYEVLTLIYSSGGLNQKVIECTTEAEEKGVMTGLLYHNRGFVYLFSGKIVEGKEDLTKAIELFGNKVEKLEGSYLWRGMANIELNLLEDGLNDLGKAETLNPNNPVVYIFKGRAFIKKNDLEIAKEEFEKAVALGGSKGWQAYIDLSKLYEKKGNLENAKQMLTKYLETGCRFKHEEVKERLEHLEKQLK